MPAGIGGRVPPGTPGSSPALSSWLASLFGGARGGEEAAEEEREEEEPGWSPVFPAEPEGFLGDISVAIWFFVSGPRRYESAQRVWKSCGVSACTLCSRNTRFASPASVRSIVARSKLAPALAEAPSSPSSTRSLSRSVCSLPRNHVPQFASPL